MQVEHIAWVCFAARWATQQQGDRTVGLSLLGQIIVDHQNVLALVHPLLTQRCTCERCEPLEASGIGCWCSHDGGVLQRAVFLEGLADGSDGRALLTNRHVDTTYLLGGITSLPVCTLVQNGIDADRGLTGLTVANDQLTLTTANRGHCIDSLDAGLHWLFHWLTLQHRGSLQLQHAVGIGFNSAETIDGLAQWVDNAAEEVIPDRNG